MNWTGPPRPDSMSYADTEINLFISEFIGYDVYYIRPATFHVLRYMWHLSQNMKWWALVQLNKVFCLEQLVFLIFFFL